MGWPAKRISFCVRFCKQKSVLKLRFVLLLRNGCGLDENLLESLAFLILKQCQPLCVTWLSCATYLSAANNLLAHVIVAQTLLAVQTTIAYVWAQTECMFARVQDWFNVAFSAASGLNCIIGLTLRSNERPKKCQNSFCSRKAWVATQCRKQTSFSVRFLFQKGLAGQTNVLRLLWVGALPNCL